MQRAKFVTIRHGKSSEDEVLNNIAELMSSAHANVQLRKFPEALQLYNKASDLIEKYEIVAGKPPLLEIVIASIKYDCFTETVQHFKLPIIDHADMLTYAAYIIIELQNLTDNYGSEAETYKASIIDKLPALYCRRIADVYFNNGDYNNHLLFCLHYLKKVTTEIIPITEAPILSKIANNILSRKENKIAFINSLTPESYGVLGEFFCSTHTDGASVIHTNYDLALILYRMKIISDKSCHTTDKASLAKSILTFADTYAAKLAEKYPHAVFTDEYSSDIFHKMHAEILAWYGHAIYHNSAIQPTAQLVSHFKKLTKKDILYYFDKIKHTESPDIRLAILLSCQDPNSVLGSIMADSEPNLIYRLFYTLDNYQTHIANLIDEVKAELREKIREDITSASNGQQPSSRSPSLAASPYHDDL